MERILPDRERTTSISGPASDCDSMDADGNGGSQRPAHSYELRDLAETLAIDLPSGRTFSLTNPPQPIEAAAIQMELRLLYVAMDVALALLRRGLVDQAYIFRRDIRQSASSGNAKLGYDTAKKAREHARTAGNTNKLHADTYRSLRSRMLALHWDRTSRMARTVWTRDIEHYQPLTKKDIECKTSTYDVKDHSGRFELPWFWKLNRRVEHALDDDAYIADCMWGFTDHKGYLLTNRRGQSFACVG